MKKAALGLIIASLLFIGAGCFGPASETLKPVTLEYWRTDNDNGSMSQIIAAYRKIRPQVQVNVTMLAPENYERKLLEALAVDKGPDIMDLPNVWMRSWRTKLAPAPKELKLQVQTVGAGNSILVATRTFPAVTAREVVNNYVETVASDVIMPGEQTKPDVTPPDAVYGLPLSLDTPALYYNRILLKRAKLDNPPKSWEDVRQLAITLTAKDASGDITLSGAALGTAANVSYAADIVASLMMQNGAEMAGPDSYAAFDRYPSGYSGNQPPAIDPLVFYDSFATRDATNYSWNDSLPNSLDAFIAGKTALFFGFPSDTMKIRTLSPQLDFGVAPFPQTDPSKPAIVARYPVEVVSKKTKKINEAWDFIQFLTKAENASTYLAATKRPTALRSLIRGQLTDPDIAPFVGQVFTAKSWYRGKDYARVESIFADLINFRQLPNGPDYGSAIREAASLVNQTF